MATNRFDCYAACPVQLPLPQGQTFFPPALVVFLESIYCLYGGVPLLCGTLGYLLTATILEWVIMQPWAPKYFVQWGRDGRHLLPFSTLFAEPFSQTYLAWCPKA